MKRPRTILALAAAAVLALSGCAREFDIDAVNATQVPGSGGIYRFCDGATLIYFTSRSGSEDELEAIWPDMCYVEDGRWVYSTDPADYEPPTAPRADGNVPEDDD